MITTGVLGGNWRASISTTGALQPWDGDAVLDWHVAADDRWHSPAYEPAVRQARVEGTAVVETRLRVPDGDAVQRIWSVPDGGGMTIVEIENASPLPIAVAFTRGDLLTPRPPTAPIEGIVLPAGSVAFPIGHRASLTVALAHRSGSTRSAGGGASAAGAGALPSLPPMAGVVRGWLSTTERAGRILLPEKAWNERVVAARCELALAGPVALDEDPVGFVLGVDQVVRMGERVDDWLADVAAALERCARRGSRDWTFSAALDAAERLFAGDARARGDVWAMRAVVRVADDARPDSAPADDARFLAWLESSLVRADGTLLAGGWPAAWLGANFEVYGLPCGPDTTVSLAVRWHGARPAVLWEQTGAPRELVAPAVAPGWSTSGASGETLWPAP